MARERAVRRAFRLDCSIRAQVKRIGPGGSVQAEALSGYVCNISESGCKVALHCEGADAPPVGARLQLSFDYQPPLVVTADVMRCAEQVEGWGCALGVAFRDLNAREKTALQGMFVSEGSGVSSRDARRYRHLRRNRLFQRAGILVGAVLVGLIAMLLLRRVPEVLQREIEEARQREQASAKTRPTRETLSDTVRDLTPSQRKALLENLSDEERQQLREAAQTVDSKTRKELSETLSAEEKRRVKKLLRDK